MDKELIMVNNKEDLNVKDDEIGYGSDGEINYFRYKDFYLIKLYN